MRLMVTGIRAPPKNKQNNRTKGKEMKTKYIATALAVTAGLFLATPRLHADDKDKDKKDKKVIGTDKKTGGEAPGDREKVEDIKRGSEKLKERKERENRERPQQKEKQEKEKKNQPNK
jgi:hypothetical protein